MAFDVVKHLFGSFTEVAVLVVIRNVPGEER